METTFYYGVTMFLLLGTCTNLSLQLNNVDLSTQGEISLLEASTDVTDIYHLTSRLETGLDKQENKLITEVAECLNAVTITDCVNDLAPTPATTPATTPAPSPPPTEPKATKFIKVCTTPPSPPPSKTCCCLVDPVSPLNTVCKLMSSIS